jgi:tetratricopeptide (TPR) repeat protein
VGGGNRPTTLPGEVGPGTGGGLSGGNRPGIGGGNRPTTLPGQIAGGGPNGNRPGIGGNRPGIGGDRPGVGGNWPNRPGDRPGRPGIGGNRPGIGNGLGNNVGNGIGNGIGNNIGNSIGGNNNFNNINVNGGGYGGRWGYPGGGYGGGYGGGWGGGYGGGWANNWNNGFVNPHYGGWYSGCWNGNWGNNYGYGGGGWWAPLAFGAATWGLASTIGGWGLGYGSMGYGGAGYVNPYYSSIPAAVVASSPYDYSQPVVVNNYITNDGDLSNATDAQGGVGGTADGGAGGNATAAPVNNEANAAVDDALAKFKAGDYAGALAGFDRAVKASPKDSVIHEVRALTLFALGRYPEAAATLNSVLVSAPGMDWTTISNVYGSVDAYTAHLRKLEDFCRANPDSASGHFVLAYHYLVGGHADMAAEALKIVVAKQPGDLVAKRLLEAITPPEEPKAEATQPAATASQPATASQADAAAPAGPETDLVGTWKAVSGKDTVMLTITEDSKFTWKAAPAGRPPVELSGTVETARDAIALNTEKAGSMVGNVKSKGADAFDFTLVGAPKEAKPLEFQRQK